MAGNFVVNTVSDTALSTTLASLPSPRTFTGTVRDRNGVAAANVGISLSGILGSVAACSAMDGTFALTDSGVPVPTLIRLPGYPAVIAALFGEARKATT